MDFAKYATFSVTDFLADDDFIDGVLQPTTQTALFWSQLAERYPAQKDTLAQATAIVRGYRQQDTFASPALAAELWQRIEAEVGPVTMAAKPRAWARAYGGMAKTSRCTRPTARLKPWPCPTAPRWCSMAIPP